MASIARGPFNLTWGANTLTNISEISVDYSHDSEDYTTVQHQTYELDGPMKASVTLTLLASDVASLAALLPQYHVANSQVLSTGETVSDTDGAVDVLALSCDDEAVYNDLDIQSCGDPGQVFRLVNARTKLDGIEFDDKVRMVMIRFVGEPAQGQANVQFFKAGTIAVVS